MKNVMTAASLLILSILVVSHSSQVIAQVCKPSGLIKGRNLPPCDHHEDGSECCLPGKLYPVYKCSPPVSNSTKAILTLTDFPKNGDISTSCDAEYHKADDPVVALSSGWYNGGERCLGKITIRANGRYVTAQVIDVCDSTGGCNKGSDYQPPCGNNIVEGSVGVWKALRVPEDNWGEMDITWSDA